MSLRPLLGPSGAHRIGILLRRPVGLIRATLRYLGRTTPVHRSQSDGDRGDIPPPIAPGEDVQTVQDGVGPLLRRRYSVLIDGADISPETLIAGFGAAPNRGAPADVAVFVKTEGRPGVIAAGDEFLIRMPGPWDGPVRVATATPTSFRLVTLRGHLEAGQIEFRSRHEDGALLFEIESWARPGDRLSHVLYNRLWVAREVQLNLWVETCIRLAARSGGQVRNGVQVHTRTVPEEPATG
ncbi:MAG: DUF1990 domain-containing protein [Pseudonocardia sp.]|nr:DUF1990 domain-containing protein [Pseudonocardia sp.]